jgi:hypothetical protein
MTYLSYACTLTSSVIVTTMAADAPKGWQQEVHDAIVHQDARCDGIQGAL